MRILERKLSWLLAHRRSAPTRLVLQACAEVVLSRAPLVDDETVLDAVMGSLPRLRQGVDVWHAELIRRLAARAPLVEGDPDAERASLTRALAGVPALEAVPTDPHVRRLLRRARDAATAVAA